MFAPALRGLAGFLVAALTAFGAPAAFAQTPINVAWGGPAAFPPQTPLTGPFGLDAVPVTGGEILEKWSRAAADIRAEKQILASCSEHADLCPPAAQAFLAVIAEGRAREGRARIGVINRAINLAVRPTSDLMQWGLADRWSGPLATFTTGRGDCEDYAIAKYVALREAGVADEDVRLLIVRDLAAGQDHAVVAARLDGRWIVLDNRRLVLLPDDAMREVLPLFMLDGDGVKQFAPATTANADRAAARASAGANG